MPSRSSRRMFGDGPLTACSARRLTLTLQTDIAASPNRPGGDVERRLVAEEADGDRRRRHTENQGQDHRGHEERRRFGDLLAGDQCRDARRFCRSEDLSRRAEQQRDHDERPRLTAQRREQLRQRDEQDETGADHVGADHQHALVVSIRVDAGRRAEQDARQRVRDHQHRLQRRALRERVHEDEQREHEELVGELREQLGQPQVAEVAAAKDGGEALALLRGSGDRRARGVERRHRGAVVGLGGRACDGLPHRVTDLTSATARARSSHSSRRKRTRPAPRIDARVRKRDPRAGKVAAERTRDAVAQRLAARLEERLGEREHRRRGSPDRPSARARS